MVVNEDKSNWRDRKGAHVYLCKFRRALADKEERKLHAEG